MALPQKATVSTPQELQEALADGAPHIEVTQHLDLRTLQQSTETVAPATATATLNNFPIVPQFLAPPTLRSIQVLNSLRLHCY